MANKVIGQSVYIEANTGTEQSPVWKKVGGQRGASLTFTMETVDLTDKDNEGWYDLKPSLRSVELSCDALLVEDDAGLAELKKGFFEKKILHLRVTTPDKIYTGKWALTELSLESPYDDAAAVSVSFKNAGEITESEPEP